MSPCVDCGNQLPDDATQCPNCGAAVHRTVTSPPVAQESRTPSTSIHGRFEPGTRLGTRYRIVGLLGRGGMGEVYRADDLELGQSVALKFLPARVAADPSWLGRFRNEVRTARQIAHANVCRIYDIAEEDGHVFLSMEYIDGEDLSGVLRRLGRPSKEKAIEIARQICLGLAAAHENKVLHRDLKPANIMIDGRGRVRITDFGLAGFLDELEQTESHAGTPAYMAPEQLAEGKVSARSDIYSIGLIIYELFTGKRVFETNDIEELKSKHTSGTVSTPSSLSEQIDPVVERVIMRCLEQQADDRPQSVYQVLAALPGGDPLAAALAAGETPSPELVANARDAGGLRPPIAVGLLAAMLVFLAITYFVQASRTVMPQRSPAVLSVVAEQVMEELGYVDLPGNSVAEYNVNNGLSESLRSSPLSYEALAAQTWPPRFRYWRRWTDGVFIPVNFHFPHAFGIDGPTEWSNHDALVALDSTGRLLELLVSPSSPGVAPTAVGDVDWSPIFRRANLDESSATRIPLVKKPPVDCDETVAWRMEGLGQGGDPVTLQMGADGGRLNYFEILGLDEAMLPRFPDSVGFEILWVVVDIIIIILAWRNLRASRGDRRNAFRVALIVGVLYFAMEVLSIRLVESRVSSHLNGLLDGRAAGHFVVHALKTWLAYMAIEPYVRRVWPRMLVGLVRLLSGRLRDPAVGREVLFGVVTGCGLVTAVAITFYIQSRIQAENTGRLPFWVALAHMKSTGSFVTFRFHMAASAVLAGVETAGYILVVRLLMRHSRAAIVGSMVVVGLLGVNWYMILFAGSTWLAVTYAIVYGVAIVLLYQRVGMLAVIVSDFIVKTAGVIMIDFDSWFAPYAMATLAILAALAAYGFWVSLAGQPILRDMLAEPQAKA